MKVTKEKDVFKVNGFLMLFALIVVFGINIIWVIKLNEPQIINIVVFLVAGAMFGGFYTIQPNESRVLLFFGKYIGSTSDDGFWWSNPFTA